MTGVFLFLGYKLYEAQVKITELSEIIEQPLENTEISVTQDDELLLKITGINKSKQKLEKICFLSVVKDNKGNETEFYLDGTKRTNKNDCQKNVSTAIPKKDGTWSFNHPFPDLQSRTIKVEKIYQDQSSSSYIKLNFDKSD